MAGRGSCHTGGAPSTAPSVVNIQLRPDLHPERQPDVVPRPAPVADLLVLAGDVGACQRGSALPGRGEQHFPWRSNAVPLHSVSRPCASTGEEHGFVPDAWVSVAPARQREA